MRLELCPYPNCDSDVNWYPEWDGHVKCLACGATGPVNDPDGEKWNAVARAAADTKKAVALSEVWEHQYDKAFDRLTFKNVELLKQRDEARRIARKQYTARQKAERERDELRGAIEELIAYGLPYHIHAGLTEVLERTK